MEKSAKGLGRPLAASAALVPCVYMVLFSKWIGIDLLYQKWNATLWKVGKLFSGVADTASEFGLSELSGSATGLCLLLYLLLIAALVTIALSVKSIVFSFKRDEPLSTAGYWSTMVLSVIVLLTVWIFNAVVKNKSDGWLDSILTLTSAPYLSLLFSIAGVVCCKYIPETALSNLHAPKLSLDADALTSKVNALTHKVDEYVKTVKTAAQTDSGLPCTYCGAKIAEQAYQFCPYCGKN